MKELRPYQKIAVKECWDALRLNNEPVLLMASVGSGKSLMLASILITLQKAGKLALCLVNNAELVRNNCATFIEQGGKASIYCTALGQKNIDSTVIFGTPQSILNGINKNEEILQIKFNIIIIDEAHTVNYLNDSSTFMRILCHYKQKYENIRVLGATGTNFRYKGTKIVGDNCLFKRQTGNITTEWLINNGYLVKPLFGIDENLFIDFSKVKIKNNGKFDHHQLKEVVNKNTRLTKLICNQIVQVVETQNRLGVFIFATTKKHAYEILSYLPRSQSALMLGNTKQADRTKILEGARQGTVKYLVNIAIISVGVDIPSYDTIAYLRPTESLVLLIQTLGRALRLSPENRKKSALILDYAGNIERHQNFDDPILLDALHQTVNKDKPFVILCPACQSMNTEFTRRCVGNNNEKRCDYYFEFKECSNCKINNDIAARHCRACNNEIINPNNKLKLDLVIEVKKLSVIDTKYIVSKTKTSFRINCSYKCKDSDGKIASFYEYYTPISEKSKNIFYGQFVKKHCDNPSEWYKHLSSKSKVIEMLHQVNNPTEIMVKKDRYGYKIQKKIF